MTYRRNPFTWQGAIARAVAAIGVARAAEAAGVTRSRLYQLANPMREDCRLLDQVVALDAAAHAAGAGTPISDELARRLAAAGVPARSFQARYARLAEAVGRAGELLGGGLEVAA